MLLESYVKFPVLVSLGTPEVITVSKIIVWIGYTKEVCYFIWGNITIYFIH